MLNYCVIVRHAVVNGVQLFSLTILITCEVITAFYEPQSIQVFKSRYTCIFGEKTLCKTKQATEF
jgi:hypothetical protein